ncbi:MAG: tetratricopeptide repeat protein [Myxococcota bacterium]
MNRLFDRDPSLPRVGRYTVLERIGRGGMGTVYAAYDEQLDRKVALKVLHDGGGSGSDGAQRLQREAQAMARLSHPNVVTVHEVGESQGVVFMAMEFIRGESLSSWMTTKPQWPEIRDVFLQVARGLLAAHEAGLVHRDLKPQNIMRADDGRVKVLDFGLARSSDQVEYSEDTADFASSDAGLVPLSTLTRTGAVMGTPPYMSPEQHEGKNTDARSDQYTFCLVLWQAIVGKRPFRGHGMRQLWTAKRKGPPAWPDPAPAVPKAVVDAIRKGLRAAPDDRWPSMASLVDVLSQDHDRPGAWGWLGFGVVGLTMAAVLGLTMVGNDGQQCSGAEAKLDGIWDDARRQQVQEVMLGIERDYAARVWGRVHEDLDAYRDGWVDMHTEACEASTVRGEQSAAIMDLRMTCLHRASVALGATVEVLSSADTLVVRRAHELTGELPPLSRCADIEALSAQMEPPLPQEAANVQLVRDFLLESKVQRDAGKFADAQAEVDAAENLARTEEVEYAPLRSELALERGMVALVQGEFTTAEEALMEAVESASHHGQLEVAGRAAIGLMRVVGVAQQRPEVALQHVPLAKGFARGDLRLEAEVASSIGAIRRIEGKFEDAERQFRIAIRNLEEAFGAEDPRLAKPRDLLSTALMGQGKFDEAEKECRDALQLRQQTLGPDHPEVASSRNNLANILASQGDYLGAEAELRATLELLRASLAPDHPNVATAMNNLAAILGYQGKQEEAESVHREVLLLRESSVGPEHPTIADSRNNLAIVLQDQGKYAEAMVEHRKAIEIRTAALGSEHPLTAASRNNLAVVLLAQGKLEEAEAEQRATLELRERALGTEHPDVAASRGNLGTVLRAQGRFREAEVVYRKALAQWQAAVHPGHPGLAMAHFSLGEILYDLEQYEEAETEHRIGLRLREATLSAEHYEVGESLRELAKVLLARDRAEAALPPIERAWSIFEVAQVPPEDSAVTAFVLARVLWANDPSPPERVRALRLAERAAQFYADAGSAYEDNLQEVRQWLEARLRSTP